MGKRRENPGGKGGELGKSKAKRKKSSAWLFWHGAGRIRPSIYTQPTPALHKAGYAGGSRVLDGAELPVLRGIFDDSENEGGMGPG